MIKYFLLLCIINLTKHVLFSIFSRDPPTTMSYNLWCWLNKSMHNTNRHCCQRGIVGRGKGRFHINDTILQLTDVLSYSYLDYSISDVWPVKILWTYMFIYSHMIVTVIFDARFSHLTSRDLSLAYQCENVANNNYLSQILNQRWTGDRLYTVLQLKRIR